MTTKSLYLGPVMILIAHVFYAMAHSLVKILSLSLTTSQLMFFRFAIGVCIIAPFLIMKHKPFELHRPWLIVLRAFFGISGMACFFYALTYGEIGKTNLLFQLTIVWTFLISTFMLKEKAHIYSKIALPASFFGLYIVLSPGDNFSLQLTDLFAIIGSLCNTGVILTIKELRKDHNSLSIVIVNYSLSSLVVSWPAFSTPFSLSLSLASLVLLMGVAGISGQLLMTEGFKYTPAWLSSALALAGIPLLYVSGILFFNEVVTLSSFIGISILVVSLSVLTIKQ